MKKYFIATAFLFTMIISNSFAQQITKFGVVDTAKVYNAYFRNSAPIRNFEKKKAEFQDEINKKLDLFVLNGTFENCFANYVRPAFKNIADILNNQNLKINAITNSSPLFTNSVDNMKETDKIYVNTSDGNWYYNNGISWVSGGVYEVTNNPNVDTAIEIIYDTYKSSIDFTPNIITSATRTDRIAPVI